MSVNLIVAVGAFSPINGYPIGKNGKIPWHNSADLKWFKETTIGHPVIMGRKTFESLEKPLVGRTNIIVTKQTTSIKADYDNTEVSVQNSLEDAIKYGKSIDSEVFVIGGASIYKYALENDLVDKMYIDFLSERGLGADAFFPGGFFGTGKWKQDGDVIEIEPKIAYAVIFSRIRGTNNRVDEQYLKLIKEIIETGEEKNTRAGKTRSVFSRQLRFNLKDGLPMLTTKKVFSKGVIYELLWFLKGDTNIKHLVDNGVHIWDDDAYRYYLELCKKENEYVKDMFIEHDDGTVDKIEPIEPFDKETFLNFVKLSATYKFIHTSLNKEYVYGDLNNVYGYQWTKWGGHNQIQDVIDTLKNNPDDRRMIVSAWNVDDIPNMALPPCHFCCQFYTKKMTLEERLNWVKEKRGEDVGENIELLDEWSVPTRKLSCVWHQRSVDCGLGLCWNILSYALLTHMVAQCVGMDVDELVFDGGDCHVYENHIEPLKEQLKRNPHLYALPELELKSEVKSVFDFKYDDIKIVGYESYPAIKMQLSVG